MLKARVLNAQIQFIRRIGNARQEQDPQIADNRPKVWKRTVYFDAQKNTEISFILCKCSVFCM